VVDFNGDCFEKTYNLEPTSYLHHIEKIIIVMYFSFTTLSTVGFGDLHPKTSQERAAAVLVMLFCTAIFSLILGEFLKIVEKYKLLDEEIGDGD